jgi:hypothetical protein
MVVAGVLGFGLMLTPAIADSATSTTDETTQAPPAATGSGTPAQFDMMAAATAGGGSGDKWRFSVIPLSFWGLGIEGPLCVKGACRNVNASFGDLKDEFDRAMGIGFEFGKGAWGAYVNASEIDFVEEDARFTTPGGGTTNGDIEFDWSTIEVGGTWRFPTSGGNSPVVDFLYGARFTQMELSAFSGGGVFDESESVNWTDPMIGLRLAQPLGKNWAIALKSTAAGFSASSNSSKMTWDITGGVGYNWKFTNWGLGFFGGWKSQELDYRDDDPAAFQAILRFQGPVFTTAINW